MPKHDKRRSAFKQKCETASDIELIDLLAETVSESTSQRDTGWVEATIDFAIWAEEYIIAYTKQRLCK